MGRGIYPLTQGVVGVCAGLSIARLKGGERFDSLSPTYALAVRAGSLLGSKNGPATVFAFESAAVVKMLRLLIC
jgi:hypothetical protein